MQKMKKDPRIPWLCIIWLSAIRKKTFLCFQNKKLFIKALGKSNYSYLGLCNFEISLTNGINHFPFTQFNCIAVVKKKIAFTKYSQIYHSLSYPLNFYCRRKIKFWSANRLVEGIKVADAISLRGEPKWDYFIHPDAEIRTIDETTLSSWGK